MRGRRVSPFAHRLGSVPLVSVAISRPRGKESGPYMVTKMTEDWKPRAKEAVVEQEIEDELLILNRDANQVYVLNTLAAAIYDLCDGKTQVSEIATILKSNLPSAQLDMDNEIRNLLSTLLEKGILE